MFVLALAAWEATGIETDDLKELGGDFLQKAASSGWIAGDHAPPSVPEAQRRQTRPAEAAVGLVAPGTAAANETVGLAAPGTAAANETAGRQLVMTEAERATLFRVRWSELTGLREKHPFSPSLNEWRVYFRFMLEHPDVEAATPRRRAERRLEYVAALDKLDPEFPAAFARGVLEYELGHYARAAQAFQAHLERHPTGPWDLRARNHLAAALHAERGR
jgi:hypothetical protein